jgi:hypothetical protein|tara:strand:- start:185 stop:763 length:579 start_codon:yes stop_codon:yes gene_type:complete
MINDFISVYDNSFTSDECEEYINLIEHYIINGVITKEDRAYHNTDHFSLNFNNDVNYNILSGDNLSMEFLPKIKDFVDEYLKKFSVLGQEKLLIYDTKAKKIPIGGGFHNWHYENTGLQVSARKLVIQLYLNTIEEGGETEFLYINKRIKAEQGRLIIFPAAFTHTHRGNPPIGQDKYIVSTWAVSQDNNWR